MPYLRQPKQTMDPELTHGRLHRMAGRGLRLMVLAALAEAQRQAVAAAAAAAAAER